MSLKDHDYVECRACQGMGFHHTRCSTCGGHKKINDGIWCSTCGGTGMHKTSCPTCHGKAVIPRF